MELNGQLFSALILTMVITQCLFSIIHLGFLDIRKNRWAMVFFFAFVLHLTGVLLRERILNVTNLPIFSPASMMLLPPALFLYVRDILGIPNKKAWLHLLPFIIYFIFFLIIGVPPDPGPGIGPPPQVRRNVFFAFVLHTFAIGSILQSIIYYGLTIKLVLKNRKKSPGWFSHQNAHTSLKWILWILLLNVFNFGLSRFAHGKQGWLLAQGIQFPVWMVHFFTLVLTSVFAMYAFRQPILYPKTTEQETDTNSSTSMPLTTKHNISSVENQLLKTKLETLMTEKQPYLQPKIKVIDIANALEIPPHILSRFINETYGYNFFHFINQYRLRYAADLLKNESSKRYTIEGIGKQAGFSSKSTFNTRFKDFYGVSPSVYRKTERGPANFSRLDFNRIYVY